MTTRLNANMDTLMTQVENDLNNVADQDYFRDSVALGPRLSLVVGKYYEPPRWYGAPVMRSGRRGRPHVPV